MKLFIALSVLLAGCASSGRHDKTYEGTLTDPQGRSDSQHIVDQTRCGMNVMDIAYYMSCMDLKGYKLVP